MTGRRYDVIVAGARCARSPTAMLLARKGYRILLLDRARFPSDTVSTHLIHAPALPRPAAGDCWTGWRPSDAPITTYSFDFGPLTLSGTPQPAADGTAIPYCPRRTVLDKLLIDAAGQAGKAEERPRTLS